MNSETVNGSAAVKRLISSLSADSRSGNKDKYDEGDDVCLGGKGRIEQNYIPLINYSMRYCDNHRSRKKILSVEGPIAVGKTTLIRFILDQMTHEHIKFVCVEEPVEKWRNVKCETMEKTYNLLDEFYKNQGRYSFIFQINALLTRAFEMRRSLHEAIIKSDENTVLIVERSPFTDLFVFAGILHEQGHIDDIEMGVYEGFFEEFVNFYEICMDGIIHLDCTPDASISKIKTRGRPEELDIGADYLQSLKVRQDNMVRLFSEKCGIPTLKIQCNEVKDIEKNIYQKLDQVKTFVSGLDYKSKGSEELKKNWKTLLRQMV